jgi:hypothetical protein
LADVFFHLCDTLGWARFPMLTQAIKHIVQPAQVNVTGNLLIGQNDISIALGGPDEQTREMRRAELTAAFMADLRALGRAVIVFDVFEKCDPSLQMWFVSVFLPAVHRSPDLAVIIAGQYTPEQTQMWEYEPLALTGIAPEHWQHYAESIGVMVNLDIIKGICLALKGRCLDIAQTLESQRGSRL